MSGQTRVEARYGQRSAMRMRPPVMDPVSVTRNGLWLQEN